MQTDHRWTLAAALVAVGCGSDAGSDGSGAALRSEDGGGESDVTDVVLDCERGEVGEIQVVFECDEITVYTCKDLSNVVLEFEDGERVRFMGVNGHVNTFEAPGAHAGERVVGVWVKSGNNASGDGPGYGERFDAPEDSCDDPPEGGSGGDGEGGSSGEGGGGSGGNGGDPCEDFDPDTFCDEGDAPPGGGEAGEGGGEAGEDGGDNPGDEGDPGDEENGGDPQYCVENPSDPACTVD